MLFSLVKIEGESLWPELVPGKKYLAVNFLKIRVGDFIVFKNPKNKRETFVKKVAAIKDGGFIVCGAVSWSDPSEKFGIVPKKSVLGKIICSVKI